ncbi:unnamed protein product [Triticum turgidum subsp. durum]|uniref:BURP domain-containing protein n=1 Tax=Triticum turgidum subsp. durum TaxID=4567 RepID=A0A9R1AWZ7_TRITD|nr:unnamed protein product [Triticum turgidum subsp. durum]
MRFIGTQIMHHLKKKVSVKVLNYAVHWDPDHTPSKENGFGASAYAVHWEPDHSPSKENGFGESAYAVHWDPDHSPSKENGFGESAYAVHWDPDHAPSKENGFGESAYAVHWDPDHAPSKENGFGESAYAVHWDPDHAPSKNGFDESAYAVHWDPDHAPSKGNGFAESSYAVHWDPDRAPSKDKGFGESAYAVHWDPDHAPSKENGFGASAYAVHWDPDHTPSKENGFGASAYAVHWDPDHSPSKENGFDASAYAVHWDPDHSPSKNGFGDSTYAVHWDPDHEHSTSAVPEAQARRHQIKVQTGMLFLKKNLRVGTVLPQGTMFARGGSPKSVNSVNTPLESKYLATILSHYKIPHSSIKAKQVADTLHSCGKPADKEEPHMCFSSREAMARFATKSLGVSGARAAITRIHGHETPNTMYVVAQIAQFSNNSVPCHPMDFPYEVFYCHRPREVQSLTVQLKGLKDGTPGVTATAMCHMNTSDWDQQYFELLGGERGEPICHYMPTNYIMFY